MSIRLLVAVLILVGVAIYSTHHCEQWQVTAMPWVKVCKDLSTDTPSHDKDGS